MSRIIQLRREILLALLTTRLQVRRVVHIARRLQVIVRQVVVIVQVAVIQVAQVVVRAAAVAAVQVEEEDNTEVLLNLIRNLTV